jgi:hypothetical protein
LQSLIAVRSDGLQDLTPGGGSSFGPSGANVESGVGDGNGFVVVTYARD